MHETLKVTSLKEVTPESPVNLERAMKADSRFGGHVVSGHVDGTACVIAIEPGENAHVFRFETGDDAIQDMIVRGSVCLDGVSLTLIDVDTSAKTFAVSIIPHTYEHTLFGHYTVGQQVNIESDMMGKYVRLHVERWMAERT